MEEYVNINHTFEPVYDKNTRILILGTFPSVKSREYGFYYGAPAKPFLAGAFWNYRFAAACFNTGKERIFIIASYRNLGCNKELYNKRF